MSRASDDAHQAFVNAAEEFTEAPPALPGLDFPDLDDRQLLDLCETLDNPHIRWCVRVLAHNRSTPLIREACRRDLRAALDIREPVPFPGRCDAIGVGGWAGDGLACERVKGHDGHHANGSVMWGPAQVPPGPCPSVAPGIVEGRARARCCLLAGHAGDHVDGRGQRWNTL